MVINKINFKECEELLKELAEDVIKLKILQDWLESINVNLAELEAELNLGKLSKKIYRQFKINLEKEKRISEAKVKSTKEKILANLKKVNKILSESKV
ncbi:MAG: hypothetical protein QXD43_02010 [Candidatus Aenigmatarchaeota archaeon]